MARTFLQLQDEVLAYQADPNNATSRARVKTWLNQALSLLAHECNLRVFQDVVSLATVANTQVLAAIPATLVRVDALTNLTANQTPEPLSPLTPKEFERQPLLGPGRPAYYTLDEGSIKIWPPPDGVYTLQLRYWAEPTAMFGDADNWPLDGLYEQAAISYAAAQQYLGEDDGQMYQVHYANWVRQKAELGNDEGFEIRDGPRRIGGTWQPPRNWR